VKHSRKGKIQQKNKQPRIFSFLIFARKMGQTGQGMLSYPRTGNRKPMAYRIGKFAELGGVSTKTLRHYEKVGLLRPAAVDARTRYRCYAATQLRDLASILALRELGLSLPEIRTFLARSGTRSDRCKLLLRLRQNTQHTIEKATQSLNHIDAVLDQFDNQPDAWARTIPVIVKHVPAIRVASLRFELKAYDEVVVQRFESELFGSLPSDSLGAVRGVLWRRCAGSNFLEAEPFTEIRYEPPRRSLYDLKDLPPVMVACAFSSTDDAAAEQAYAAIRNWMSARGFVLAGQKREIYLDHMLEIQFPIHLKQC
jgi:DNA-binding transcriptional MerR regulator